MPGVQGDDAGDGGGRVCWVEAAGGGGGGGRHEGGRLQTGVQQQTAAAVALKHFGFLQFTCVDQTSAFKAKFALICDIKTLFITEVPSDFYQISIMLCRVKRLGV